MSNGSVWKYDLFNLPPVGPWRREWARTPFANYGVRREAKALLFAELSAAMRQGCPLEQALTLIAQPSRRQVAREDNFAWTILGHVFAILIWIYGNVVYLLLSSRFINAPHVARVLASRLVTHISRGHQLSKAMRLCEPDYDEQEIALVELGECTGRLPQTLRRMVELEGIRDRYIHLHARFAYPVLVLLGALLVSVFLITMILPKFQDIFLQLGAAQLPPMTQAVLSVHHFFLRHALLTFMLIILPFVLFRATMNGNPTTRRVLIYAITLAALYSTLIASRVQNKGVNFFVLVVSFSALVFISLPFLFKGFELLLLRIEMLIRRLLSLIPQPASPIRTLAEARWVAALATGLQAGLPEPDAVRLAGSTIGRRYKVRSARAAQAIESGLPIGEACARNGLFGRELTNRLLFLDDSNTDYINRLSALAGELSIEANEQMTRYGWVAEVAGILIVGAIALCIVLAIYLPLFSIPKIMEFSLI